MIFSTEFLNQYNPKIVMKDQSLQALVRFPNGLGASVLWFDYGNLEKSYTSAKKCWELAVIKYDSGGNYELTYDYPSVTTDVLQYLTEAGVLRALKKISKL